ncbi:MAG: aminoglycoside phosphotransferase family protein [Chloroflexi bacterium]|nr:aminoglycoside phosphotransferase family protein [Chloroflexota bacterium]
MTLANTSLAFTVVDDLNIEDPAQLLRYLRQNDRIDASDKPRFTTLTGGVSNRSVWVQFDHKPDWVMKQALAKLRVQVDWFSAPARVQREAAGLSCLGEIIAGHVPELVFLDDRHHILAMSAIPHPHDNWKTLLLEGETCIRLARDFGRLLARIHNAALDHPRIESAFADVRFFEELRLEPYYGYTAAQVPRARDFLENLIQDTRKRRFALVHGDYSPKNVLINQGKLVILDFEVIHFGDPAFDIGFSMTHFLSKAHFLRANRPRFIEMAAEYWRAYSADLDAALAKRMGSSAVAHTLACLLARVAGRSPLEYLDDDHRSRQKMIVLELIGREIGAIPQLIDSFRECLDRHDEPD